MNRRELLPVEMLVRDDQRCDEHRTRVSVADHEKFLRALAAQQAPSDPLDDELEADPIVELVGRRRKNSEAARTLAILDELERSGR